MREAIPPPVDKGDLAPVMSTDGSALPFELWRGLDVAGVEKLISELEIPPRSPALHSLWKRLVTSDVTPPSGETSSLKFQALRLEALYRSGLAKDAAAELAKKPVGQDALLAVLAARNELAPVFSTGDAADPSVPLPDADVAVANIAFGPILRLAERLQALLEAPDSHVLFCNSGAEANETAFKIARRTGRPHVVAAENAFHGRSIATLSATGNTKIQAGFGPLVEGFIRVPINDIAAIKAATEGNPNVVAVFFETIQGEGGVHPMRVEYLRELRQLCDEREWLMMIDEVQCGMGRTGKWFAHQWAGIKPDVMPLAKGLGSGVPIGAVVAGPKAANIFGPGNHGLSLIHISEPTRPS